MFTNYKAFMIFGYICSYEALGPNCSNFKAISYHSLASFHKEVYSASTAALKYAITEVACVLEFAS